MNGRLDDRPSRGGFALKAAAAVAALGGVALAGLGAARFWSPTSGRSARGKSTGRPSEASLHEGYEVKDLSARSLGIIIAVLGVSAGGLVGIVFGMIALFSSWDREGDRGLTAQQTASIAPPGWRLQTQPFHDRAAETKRETQVLATYGWNDAGHTTAHVPIARAMAIVNGHSLDGTP